MKKAAFFSWLLMVCSSASFAQGGTCVTPPAGLVSWWRFQNDVLDNWDSNNGLTPIGSSFMEGKAGRAFNGTQAYVFVPDSLSLRPTNGLTIEAWINPTASILTPTVPHTIVTKSDTTYQPFPGPNSFSYFLGTTNNGRIFFSVSPTGLTIDSRSVITTAAVPTNQWTFVVATYDGTALRIYLNGSIAAQINYSGGIFPGNGPVGIGALPLDVIGAAYTWLFAGGIDEVSLYHRALSDSEIQAIFTAGSLGKCLTAPTILAQPLSQVVPQNEDVKFAVSIQGSRPLRYQWSFNGQKISGATNATLILEKLKTNNIGFYRVAVSNALGSVTSADAALKLLPPANCLTPLNGMVAWWPADNSYGDAADSATPILPPTDVPFAPTGKVSQAFSFNGVSSRLVVNSLASLEFGSSSNFSIEGWIKAVPPTQPLARYRAYLYPNTPIIEKRSLSVLSSVGYSLSLNMGRLAFWLGTNSVNPAVSNSSTFISPGPDLRDGMFHHVALSLTRNATNGGILCVDGSVVLTFDPTARRGSLVNGVQLYMGASQFEPYSLFFGLIDEMTLYNRALTTNEIAAIAGAGSAGKCKVAPFILIQPTNQTVKVGSNATFSVVAGGSPTLRYQWFRNNGLLQSATNSTLVFSNVTGQVIGSYFVRVTNYFGTVNSSNAVLLVGPASLPGASVLQFSLTGGQPLLQFTGVAGQQYLVQASTNLMDWKVIGSATDLGNGNFEFVDPDWTNYSACFYRIIVP